MKVHFLLASLQFLLFSKLLIGQNNYLLPDEKSTPIENLYKQFFLSPREQVFTHFNKSLYLPGDEIWFKNYVLDQTLGKPCKETTTLYVELYNPLGKLLEQKILNVTDGVAYNKFSLKENCLSGRYVFRAYTNWMKNFYSVNELDVSIEVAGISTRDNILNTPLYDIQFFPESGNLLAGVFNNVGIKALNPNGKGISLKGEILNEQNEVKATFILNHLGMGNFKLYPKLTSKYRAKVYLPDNREMDLYLPPTQEKGVIVSVNPWLKGKAAVEITSNKETVGTDSLFYIIIHTNGSILKSFINNLNKLKANFSVNDNELANGANCITVFNKQFEPVAERIFFKQVRTPLGKLSFEQKLINDSLEITITSTDSLGNNHPARLSMSILPEGTLSDRFSTNLYCEAMLRPGLRGIIENPMYYFESHDFEHRKALDLLFLIQGWRKYDWKSICRDTIFKYPFERLFTINGKIIGRLKGLNLNVVSLMSPDNNLLIIEDAGANGNFSFTDLKLIDKSTVMVSTSKNTGKTTNCKIEATVNPYHEIDSTIIVKPQYKLLNQSIDNSYEPVKLLPGEILLEEVAVTAKVKRNAFEGTNYVPIFEKVYEITKENYFKYPSLESVMLHEFNISELKDKAPLEFGESPGPTLFVDGIPRRTDFIKVYDITQIEAITYIKTPNAYVGLGGAIMILTRKNPIKFFSSPENLQYIKVKGYAPEVKYYTPRYLYPPESEFFQKYATIFWKPDIEIDSTGKAKFRFQILPGINEIKLQTQGFSDDGTFFNDQSTLLLKEK